RNYAWSPQGDCARRHDFFVCGTWYAPLLLILLILPAIFLDGVIHLEVINCSFTGDDFANFIHGVLNQMQPWPLPNSVLIMNNVCIHNVPGIREMVEEQ
ncbi:hypothetical protein BS17DRAFT_692210, partial [Gyrodon lividus]